MAARHLVQVTSPPTIHPLPGLVEVPHTGTLLVSTWVARPKRLTTSAAWARWVTVPLLPKRAVTVAGASVCVIVLIIHHVSPMRGVSA